MIIIESQAVKKYCQVSLGSHNGGRYCLGTMCMAWRWYSESNKTGYCGLVYNH